MSKNCRKNPENKPLKIEWDVDDNGFATSRYDPIDIRGCPTNTVLDTLSRLAIAESNLVRAGKDSALPHFIAIVKEIERILGFKFSLLEEEEDVG